MGTFTDGIWIIDSSANTVYANAAMEEILGVQASQLAGRQSFDFLFPEDVDDAAKLFVLKQRGDSAPFHFRLKRQDGTPIWVDVQGTPMHSVDGEFLGIVGTFRISARQAAKASGA